MKSKNIAMVGVLVALFSVSGLIRIPIPALVMPITLQVLVVLLAPMLVGAKISFAACLLYITLGLVGLPVFASGGGLAYVLTPSFGFLIGFALSCIPNGLIAGRSSKFVINLAGGMVGFVVYEFFGCLGFWLSMNYVQDKQMSLITAFLLSVAPFMLVDLGKLAVAASIAAAMKRRMA
jgi:biotin transport system substrate-specific component